MEYEGIKLYPNLTPSAPEGEIHIVAGSAQTYRLQKIGEIKKEIEQERDKRAALSKKYHRSVSVIGALGYIFGAVTMGLGVSGIGILSTIIAAPVAIAMEGAALGVGLLGIISGFFSKKLAMKAEKHEKIKTLADAKLNTISDHISRALMDDNISDEEYSLILSEIEKFNGMKEEIRSNIKVAINEIDEVTKQSLIDRGREEVRQCLQSMFEKNNESIKKTTNSNIREIM
jgi:hypothetical protein